MPDPVVNVYSADELRGRLQDELAKNPFLGDAPSDRSAPQEPNPDPPRAPRQ
jgi:hypothetical protein